MAASKLPKAARLSSRAEFSKVRRQGKAHHGKLMVMGGWTASNDQSARLGVITTRKVGRAVDRTRLRRRLREIFRLNRASLPSGLWMVIVPRRTAAATNSQALAEEWRALAGKAGYLKV